MFGVYVHYPYCRAICPYCDFAVTRLRGSPGHRYADAVLEELSRRASTFAGRRPVSVYFGGGTPGLWEPDELERVLGSVGAIFGVDLADLEVTLECNPDAADTSMERLAELRRAGCSRLSLGAQALDPDLLRRIGRTHRAADVFGAVGTARRAGFTNLSCDLMYGLPGHDLVMWTDTLERMLAADPDHLSIYQLTIEEGTPFGRRRPELPAEEAASAMFERARDLLAAAGYEHYEISSYARPGRRSRHNQLYWSGGEYLGLGVSAHSFRRCPDGSGVRTANTREIEAYLSAPSRAETLRETVSSREMARDAVWLGLRRVSDGVDAGTARPFSAVVADLLREGLLEPTTSGGVRLSSRGVLFADEVALRFF